MGLGAFFSKLMGGSGGQSASPAADPVEYQGFTIHPAPIAEGGQYRTAGTIEMSVDGETRSSRFIRADNNTDRQVAIDHSIQKAKQIINEQGQSLFDREIA